MKLHTIKSPLRPLRARVQPPAMNARLRGRAGTSRAYRVKVRDRFTCQVCGRVTPDGEVDHIVPLWAGGADAESNLQYLDRECHRLKSEREAAERSSGMV